MLQTRNKVQSLLNKRFFPKSFFEEVIPNVLYTVEVDDYIVRPPWEHNGFIHFLGGEFMLFLS